MEEEPPMEDLDPVMEDIGVEVDEGDDLDPAQPQLEDEDELDDLDTMVDETEEAEDSSEKEDDDMVADMLKAQGLDLAEDELDEAISTLIDDLEDDDVADDDDDTK